MAVLLTTRMFGTTAMAASAPSNRPEIEDVDYEGSGKVEVDFYNQVYYNGVKFTVKDTSGKSYSTKILEKDSDEISFKVNNVKSGKTYNFTISGIKVRGTSGYTSVSSSFKVSAVGAVTFFIDTSSTNFTPAIQARKFGRSNKPKHKRASASTVKLPTVILSTRTTKITCCPTRKRLMW